jgi:hypothetical protein
MDKNISDINYTSVDKKIDKLIHKICLYLSDISPEYIKDEINKAYIFAKEAHHGVMRLS